MRIRTRLPFVATLVISICASAHAAEEPQPANAEYQAADKAAKEAEAAAAAAKATAAQAAMAQVNAEKAAAAKRQQANEAKIKVDDLTQTQDGPLALKDEHDNRTRRHILDQIVQERFSFVNMIKSPGALGRQMNHPHLADNKPRVLDML